ncbi:hypothetical protein DT73_00500 [Mangrovibacter sp. MFB070]|uniref:hypothetical protein n=1 Tax=Mangrovibacter sp. MFB070 TaxID=1224318 RepID=UPI0004D88599|nr:hypothetical protein [Mangrovibacter sp. MFB070]KEA54678.1 hypothetical protein DT73_00500 [Mangrovibacter sp. MFB070]
MSNSFDFELTAGDKATATIIRIDEALKKLNPQIEQTRKGLKFGGQESDDKLDGLSSRLSNMSRAARDNVQFIGDMVPPLKMVGELALKFGGTAGRFGLAGAAAYGMAKGGMAAADALKQVSRTAYDLDISAKNAGMRVDDFSRLSGAMQILGADSETAHASVEGLFKTFNDAAAGNNSGVLAVMSQIGAQIVKNKNGTVDVLKTIESIAQIFPSLRPEMQKTVADALGLTPETLSLMREGNRLKELLAKSDKFGLTVDPAINNQLTELNQTINELGAAWDGLKNRTSQKISGAVLSDGSVKDGLEGVEDILTNGLDSISLSHFLGATRGKEADQLRWAYNNPEFYKSLGTTDKVALDFGVMTDGFRQRYNDWMRPVNAAEQLQADLNGALQPVPGVSEVPYDQQPNNARGLRNHNPGNLRHAPNATGTDGGFVQFNNDEDGLSAQARQLMLYGDRGNNTLNGILHTYAPSSENKTRAYIDDVSQITGYKPAERLNLHDPEVLQRLMAAMIKHENGAQPYSRDQIADGVNTAIFDDRWRGLRDGNILAQQRGAGAGDGAGGDISQAIKTAFDDNPMKLDVTITNDQTGARKSATVSSGGRVVFPMSNN